MTINILTKARPQRAALIIPPRVNMLTEVRPQRPALTISPTVNMPKGMLRLE